MAGSSPRWSSDSGFFSSGARFGLAIVAVAWPGRIFITNAIAAVRDGDSGKMVALRGTDIVRVPLAEATGTLKTVPIARYEEAAAFFG